MGTTNYIILRKLRIDPSTGLAHARGAELRDRGEAADAPGNFISVEAVDDRDVSDLQRDPDVQASPSVPVSLVRPVGTEDSGQDDKLSAATQSGGSWGVLEVAPNATTTAGSGVKVAVLDTGIDADHPAFKGVSLLQKNFSASPYPEDRNGHGTHCAGTIFGRDVEGVRIGVARGVREALIGKVLDDKGYGTTEAIARGIQWAQQAGAQVISVSIGINFVDLVQWHQDGGKEYAEALSLALVAFRDTVRVFDSIGQTLGSLSALQARGVVIVAAGGNESGRMAKKPYVVDVGLPASALDTISVGAIGRGSGGYQIAPFSNLNPQLCAPGVGIVSARHGGGLALMSGTSMAAPHVAGLSALWWERSLEDNPKASGELVRSQLRSSCLKTGFAPGVTPSDRGAGLVRAPAPE